MCVDVGVSVPVHAYSRLHEGRASYGREKGLLGERKGTSRNKSREKEWSRRCMIRTKVRKVE